jgi:AraC-like DNA-binding protein
MDYTIIMPKTISRVLKSYFHTPGVSSQELFHTVLRAGHMQASPDYRVERRACPGHDLLLCVTGAGFVQCGERVFAATAGQLAWIDGRQSHAHWADPHQPWELLWLRIDGRPSRLFADALGVREAPLFGLQDDIRTCFSPIFALLRERPLSLDAALHAAVTALIARLFDSRQPEMPSGEPHLPEAQGDRRLQAVLARLRLDHRRAWTVDELARLAGLSVPHFFRRFRKATGSSPIDWLRRERVNQAKRRLSESEDRIRDIALELGYGDPFYFSRDFKKLVGLSPRHYRIQERMPPQGRKS